MLTQDGSHTIAIPELQVTYHSTFGAVQESKHVFIEAGLTPLLQSHNHIHILEVGFGTGLNALLSLGETEKTGSTIAYTAIEPFPLTKEEVQALNYCDQLLRPDLKMYFQQMHACGWEKEEPVTSRFSIYKTMSPLQVYSLEHKQQLIFFDAFAPTAQPELWNRAVFDQLYQLLDPGGMLVTYCSKGSVRRTMQSAGFTIEKLPGPPGKREMIRAMK
jgi:tRNA U34 5-methylaminomethyl-2-thiouridine-forming methyltransferase MnmC